MPAYLSESKLIRFAEVTIVSTSLQPYRPADQWHDGSGVRFPVSARPLTPRGERMLGEGFFPACVGDLLHARWRQFSSSLRTFHPCNSHLVVSKDIAFQSWVEPGAMGTILLLQKWEHNKTKWESLSVEQQEKVIGRRKSDIEELEDKPADSHVASTDQDTFGKIFRRNMPYGTVTDHGTMFVGFSAEQARLSRMLESMAGLVSGKRDL